MLLGEEKFSYGYGGTGKASTDCKFSDFGETFGEGDAIACYLVSFSVESVLVYKLVVLRYSLYSSSLLCTIVGNRHQYIQVMML